MMTVTDIRDHVERLQGRLDEERRKLHAGEYSGHPHANAALIDALAGRVTELAERCDLLECMQGSLGTQPSTLDLLAFDHPLAV
jgi:hypothetical protein